MAWTRVMNAERRRASSLRTLTNHLPNQRVASQTTYGAQPQEVLHRYFVDSRPTTKDCLLAIEHD